MACNAAARDMPGRATAGLPGPTTRGAPGPATAGVLHGESVHKCLCRECATHLKESNVQHCPMCREPIQAFIMRVF